MDNQTINALLQGSLLILLAPALAGLVAWYKARGQGRQGVGPLQPYRDLRKYFGCPALHPAPASWVYRAAPYLALAAYGALAFLTPVLQPATLVPDELITLLYLLGLARFGLSLAGLDSGGPFAGLGAGRVMFLHFLTEPGWLVVFFALALWAHTTTLSTIIVAQRSVYPAAFLLLGAFFLLLLTEAARLPVDNPETTLELTATEPNLGLEYAGYDRGVLEWAEMIKFAALIVLFCKIFWAWSLVEVLPSGMMPPGLGLLGAIELAVKVVLVLRVLAWWELIQPKLRLRQVARLNVLALGLAILAVILLLALPDGG